MSKKKSVKEIDTKQAGVKDSPDNSKGKRFAKHNSPKEYGDRKPIYKRGPNDIAWRTGDVTLSNLAASLPFGLAAGLNQNVTSTLGNQYTFRQPGVMSILVDVTAGKAVDYNSPVNLAVRKIYSFVRHANSGSRNYEAVDMGLYFISVGQALAMLGYLQRVLRTISEFSATNRYTPLCLLHNMGVNGDDLLASIPQLKYLISWLGKAIGSLAFPDIPYFHACYEAFKYVYVDNDSPKEQYYLLNPRVFGVYNPTYDSNGGGVDFENASNNAGIPTPDNVKTLLLDFTGIQTMVKTVMDVLLGDEDIGIISGDILKAFADGKLFKPESFGLEYDLFQHSPEVLEQIHNASIYRFADIDFEAYKTNPGATNTAAYLEHLITNTSGAMSSNTNDMCNQLTIDAFSRVPDAKEVINCCVLNHTATIRLNTSNQYEIDPASLDFDLFVTRGIYVTDDTTGVARDVSGLYRRYTSTFAQTTLNVIDLSVTNFDWHPIAWRLDSSRLYPIGDIQNFRMFTKDISERIHECSTLNLFAFYDHNFY